MQQTLTGETVVGYWKTGEPILAERLSRWAFYALKEAIEEGKVTVPKEQLRTVEFSIIGQEVLDYVRGLGVPVREEYDPLEKQTIWVATLTREQYKKAWDIAEETGGWVVRHRAIRSAESGSGNPVIEEQRQKWLKEIVQRHPIAEGWNYWKVASQAYFAGWQPLPPDSLKTVREKSGSGEGEKTSVSDEIRSIISRVKDNPKIKEISYDPKGIEIKWSDGEISSTLDVGLYALNWLKDQLRVMNIKEGTPEKSGSGNPVEEPRPPHIAPATWEMMQRIKREQKILPFK